jgi:putative hydrolase
MSNEPFGFSDPEPDDESDQNASKASNESSDSADAGSEANRPDADAGPRGTNPFEALGLPEGLAGGLPGFPGGLPGMQDGSFDIGAALQQLGQLLSWQGGPVNWDLARQTARQVATSGGDASVGAPARQRVAEAVRLADIWLDEACDFPSNTASVGAWSRAEWIEETSQGWADLIEPMAEQVVGAMEKSLPADAAAISGPLMGIMRQVGMSLWGAQVGQGLGELSGEVVGVTDVGFPLREPGSVALLPGNIEAFGEGLSVEQNDVLLYVALREVARHRLFGHARWLRSHLVELVSRYGRGISIDTSALESAMRDIDPSNPEALQDALSGGLFQPSNTPEQDATLERLETVLALIEGWVDDVVTAASGERMPASVPLREAVRRRRATGGPAEQTFATLVGLQMRPRRMREASTLFAALREEKGQAAREGVWAHPDLVPDGSDLDDPTGYASRSHADLDLTELTRDTEGDSESDSDASD